MTVARAGITVLRPSLPYNICDCYITVTVISSRCTLGELRQYTTARPPGNTTFVCFQHSNRKLFCVVSARLLLYHFNDLEGREPCPFGSALGAFSTVFSAFFTTRSLNSEPAGRPTCNKHFPSAYACSLHCAPSPFWPYLLRKIYSQRGELIGVAISLSELIQRHL